MRLKQTYSSREVAALTGVSARQLQLWDASGLVSPAIPPRKTPAGGYTERRYTPIDLFELLVLADLRKRGLTSHQLHEIRQALKLHFRTRLFEATGGGGDVQLLTDGQDVYARTADGRFYNLLKSPAQPLLVVGEAGALKELGAKVRRDARGRRRTTSGSGTPARDRRQAAE